MHDCIVLCIPILPNRLNKQIDFVIVNFLTEVEIVLTADRHIHLIKEQHKTICTNGPCEI